MRPLPAVGPGGLHIHMPRCLKLWGESGLIHEAWWPRSGQEARATTGIQGTAWRVSVEVRLPSARNHKYRYMINTAWELSNTCSGGRSTLLSHFSHDQAVRELLRVQLKVASFLASVPPYPYEHIVRLE